MLEVAQNAGNDFFGALPIDNSDSIIRTKPFSDQKTKHAHFALDDEMEEGSEEPVDQGFESEEYAHLYMLNTYFDNVDRDQDGALDRSEFREIVAIVGLQNGMEIGEDATDAIFSALDKDGDGKISKIEFLEGFLRFSNTEEGEYVEEEPDQGCESDDGDFEGDSAVYSYTPGKEEQLPRGVMENRVQTLRYQNRDLENENRALATRVKKQEKLIDQLNQQLKDYKKKEGAVEKLHSELFRLSSECEEFKAKAASLERKNQALQKDYDRLRATNDISPLQKSLDEANAKVLELEDFQAELQAEILRKKANEERLQKLLETYSSNELAMQLEHQLRLEKMAQENQQLLEELQELKAMYQSLEKEFNHAKLFREDNPPSPLKIGGESNNNNQTPPSLDAELQAFAQTQELPLGKTGNAGTAQKEEEDIEEEEVTGGRPSETTAAVSLAEATITAEGVEELLRLQEENTRLKNENKQLQRRLQRVPTVVGWDSSSPRALFTSTPSMPTVISPAAAATSPSHIAQSSPVTRATPPRLRRTSSTPDHSLSPVSTSSASAPSTPLSALQPTPKKRRGTASKALRLPMPRVPFLTPQPKSQSMRLTKKELQRELENERRKERENGTRKEGEELLSPERAVPRVRRVKREDRVLYVVSDDNEATQKIEREKELLRMQVDGLQKKLLEERERSGVLEQQLQRANERVEQGMQRAEAIAALAKRGSVSPVMGVGVLLFLALLWILVRVVIALSPSLLTPT